MARGNQKKDKKKNLKAHFDEDNIRKTGNTDREYGTMEITEPKTPFPRNAPPVDADQLRQRLNAELARENGTEEDQNGGGSDDRNAGGHSDYYAKLRARFQNLTHPGIAAGEDGEHKRVKINETPRREEQSTTGGQAGASENASVTAGSNVPSIVPDPEIAVSPSFEEKRRRFYAQEYKIAKQMIEKCHEIEEP